MSWGYVAVGVGTAAAGYFSSEAQKKGIDEASDIQKAEAAAAKKREDQIYGGTQAYRDLSAEAIPYVRANVLEAQPGTSPLYQRALSGGIEDIQSQLSGYGLEDSSVSGKAIGEFTGGLAAQDVENIRRSQLALAGGGTIGLPETISAGGRVTGAAANLSNLAVQEGATRGGLYGDLANIATAGIGAYKQQQGYNQQQGKYNDAIYASQGGYGPYR